MSPVEGVVTIRPRTWSTGRISALIDVFDVAAAAAVGDGRCRRSTATAVTSTGATAWTRTSGSGCPPTRRFRSVSAVAANVLTTTTTIHL